MNVCPPEHRHDENGTCYAGHGCRCDDCRRGRAEYQYWWEHMRAAGRTLVIDATGTRRRLQALAALGWSARAIGDRFGRGEGIVHRWMTRSQTVSRSTAVMVDQWFCELAMTKPSLATAHDRYSVGRARANARKRGWLPPLAWDDIDTDPHPGEAGQPEQTKGEQFLEDVGWLLESGESAEQIVIALGRKADAIAKLASRHGRRDLARPFETIGKAAA